MSYSFVTPWTVAHQTLLSMEFSRQVYWNGLPFSSPGQLPNPETEPGFPSLQADSLPSEPPGKPLVNRSDIPEKRMFEFEDISTETTQTENQGDEGLKVKTERNI